MFSQTAASFSLSASSMLSALKKGDSLVYYQCHVEEATQKISTASGQSFTSAPQKYTITEKFVVINDSLNFRCKYFISSMIILPNRKFSGLKIREKAYWNFKKEKEATLSEKDLFDDYYVLCLTFSLWLYGRPQLQLCESTINCRECLS